MLVGKIVSIQFNQFRVKIFSNVRGGALNIQGEIYYFGNIGSYLKTSNPLGEEIICEVIAIFDTDKQDTEQNFNLNSNRELSLKPIGIYKNENFTLGIGVYPSLYSDVSLLTSKDLKKILMSTQEDGVKSKSIYLGMSKNHINHPISIQIDKFFGIHSAILGNSGSGKSNTIAHLLQEVYGRDRPKNSKIIICDVNGEYSQAFSELKKDVEVKLFKPNIKESENGAEPFYMPFFLLSLDEWCAFLMATNATQKPFWEKVLQEVYRFYKIFNSTQANDYEKSINYLRYRLHKSAKNTMSQTESDTTKVTTLKSVIERIKQLIKDFAPPNNKQAEEVINEADTLLNHCSLKFGEQSDELKQAIKEIGEKIHWDQIDEITKIRNKENLYFDPTLLPIVAEIILLDEETTGNKTTRGYVGTMLTRLDHFINNSECSFMREIEESIHIEDTNKYLDYLWKGAQLVIIDTSELGKDTLETLTSVIARLVFEDRKKQEGEDRRTKPVHLILDEAHRYIRKDQKYLLEENVFERIAREGRKYSLYLLISSQRPSELSETVLSQCANFIIHRIQNENDMRHINAVLPYFSEDFVSKIKQSVAGEALVFGNFVPMPMHIKIERASPEPHSSNCQISQEWYKNGI